MVEDGDDGGETQTTEVTVSRGGGGRYSVSSIKTLVTGMGVGIETDVSINRSAVVGWILDVDIGVLSSLPDNNSSLALVELAEGDVAEVDVNPLDVSDPSAFNGPLGKSEASALFLIFVAFWDSSA